MRYRESFLLPYALRYIRKNSLQGTICTLIKHASFVFFVGLIVVDYVLIRASKSLRLLPVIVSVKKNIAIIAPIF